MNSLPPLAWIAIAAIVLITVGINYALFVLLRNRNNANEIAEKLRSRPPSQTARTIEQVKQVMQDPFRQEREQLNELSSLVNRLEQPALNKDKQPKPAEKPPQAPD